VIVAVGDTEALAQGLLSILREAKPEFTERKRAARALIVDRYAMPIISAAYDRLWRRALRHARPKSSNADINRSQVTS